MSDPRSVVRVVIEQCWSGSGDAERMAALVSPTYVHHSPYGDWSLDQFFGGLRWVETYFVERTYHVDHVIVEGDLVAAFITWSATRVTDGSPIDGRGAYHCRITDGRIHEDWDVFSPMP